MQVGSKFDVRPVSSVLSVVTPLSACPVPFSPLFRSVKSLRGQPERAFVLVRFWFFLPKVTQNERTFRMPLDLTDPQK